MEVRVAPQPPEVPAPSTSDRTLETREDAVDGLASAAPGGKTPVSPDEATTVYKVVVDLDSGAALHRARALGLQVAGSGARTYEMDRELLLQLRQAGIRTWIVGGTTRASLHPELAVPADRHLVTLDDPVVRQGSSAADYGDTIVMSSGSIDLAIPDNTGTAKAYGLRRAEAPAGARVTKVSYRTRISDEGDGSFYCGDYELWLYSGTAAYELSIYDNLGTGTDGGYDDDSADDADIYLNWRSTSFFSGEDPNQYWGIIVWDNLSGDDGQLDYIEFQVDWVVEGGDSYEPDNSAAEAYDMPHNYTSAFRSIDPVGDEDWFRFSLSTTSQVELATLGPSGDTRMWLYDSSLNQIDYDDDGGDGNFSRISRSLGAGTYYGQIDEYGDNSTISDYGLSLGLTTGQPDLIASQASHPSNVVEGDTVTMGTTVLNDGGATAGSSHVRIYLSIDGDYDVSDDYQVTPDRSIASLSPGASDTASWSFSFPHLLDSSLYVVWVLIEVDSQGEVSESSENNVFQSSGYIQVEAPGLPNLTASSVSLRTEAGGGGSLVTQPAVGQEVYPHINFTIDSDAALSGNLWRLSMDGSTLCTSNTTLDPGSYQGWCIGPWTGTAGSHVLRGVVDPDSTVAESDETDNQEELSFSTSGEPQIRIEPLALRLESGTDIGSSSAAGAARPSVVAAPAGAAGGAPPLFLEIGASVRGASLSPAAAETRRVVVNRAALAAGTTRFTVELFDGSRVFVERTDFEVHDGNRVTWRGRLADTDQRVVLSLVRNRAAGLLYTADGVYELGQLPEGAVLARLEPDRFPECGGGVPAAGEASDAPLAFSAGDDPPDQIDLLAVYTSQARDAAGGTAAIEATIQSAVDMANTAFADSGMLARFRLVHTALVSYNDSGSSSTDLNWVTADPDVASLRDQHAADLVGLVVDDGGGFCGRGWVMRNPGAGFAPNGFQVTARGCAVGNLTYAHEHGHNMGFEHDPDNGASPSVASYPYAFGHYVDGNFRTVMSYSAPCSAFCSRVAHFSNPGVSEQGYPTGIADQRDNHRAGDLTAPIVANFRQSAPADDSFVIFNDGGATLSVSSIAPQTTASWLSWTPQGAFDLAPGSSATVQVLADLANAPAGETTTRLLVYSNDADLSPYPGGVDVTTVTSTGSCSPLHLTGLSVTGYVLREACSTLRADTGVVVHSGGELVLRSGSQVVLGDGFEVRSGGRLEVGVDSSLSDP